MSEGLIVQIVSGDLGGCRLFFTSVGGISRNRMLSIGGEVVPLGLLCLILQMGDETYLVRQIRIVLG